MNNSPPHLPFLSLGVNIDHVATLRNARGGNAPDPTEAALLAEANGADGITAHLREDRRHIRDADMFRLRSRIRTRLNMEMANTTEMLNIALQLDPFMVTLVPERREELTTEGGLDVITHMSALKRNINTLQSNEIPVSLFIDPDPAQIRASQQSGARIIELHTGRYCEAFAHGNAQDLQCELQKLQEAAVLSRELGIELNAGHGLNYDNIGPVLGLPDLRELNIGHCIVSESIFTGLGPAVRRMKDLISSK